MGSSYALELVLFNHMFLDLLKHNSDGSIQ